MTEIHPKRLRVHMQSEIVALPSIQASEDVSCPSLHSAIEDGAAVLYLVYRAAEVLAAAEDRATNIEARAETLANRTTEELRLAEQRLEAADAERQTIEVALIEANSRIQEYEIALKHWESRVAAAEAKLTAAERRALEAETRAHAARAALVRIEEALRTQLLRADQRYSNNVKTAA